MAPFLMDRKPTGDEVVAAMGATGMTEHAMLLTVGGKMVANIKMETGSKSRGGKGGTRTKGVKSCERRAGRERRERREWRKWNEGRVVDGVGGWHQAVALFARRLWRLGKGDGEKDQGPKKRRGVGGGRKEAKRNGCVRKGIQANSMIKSNEACYLQLNMNGVVLSRATSQPAAIRDRDAWACRMIILYLTSPTAR